MKVSHLLALSAPLLALAAPTPANSQLSKKAETESFFLQTDVGWFDGGDKKRAISEMPSTKKRAPADADAESFFLQTDVGWFDGGDKKRASIDKRAPIMKREPSNAEAESFFLQTDVGWFDGGNKKRATGDARSKEPSWYYRVNALLRDRFLRGETDLCDDNAEARPEDYDEDLSEVSTSSCASRNGYTEGRDPDNELDRNDPSDIEYLEMKMDRRDRKRELRAQKEWEEEKRKKKEIHREQMNERLSEERRKEAQKIKAYQDAEKSGSKFDGGKFNEEQIRTLRAEKLSGHVHLLSDTVFDLENFTPPEYCSTKTHNLGTSQEPIRRETVFTNCEDEDIPWNAPSLFTYYRISERYMVDKEKQEEEEWETEEESVIE
ncbi:hypothetical protein FAGAP_4228 [Fusarium agapanthi]|uniref:Uncharacterized protein n=1 Tax=Fusarium agapanthi TaxID=1803897 RepID=A0A9P5BCW7_9HYPO|nr:hypothetical protein FAGAP_4228 [Fusarium agapanthi]